MTAVAVFALLLAAQDAGPGERGVRVHTDELGIPHVFAERDADVFRGHGFAQARDFPVATLANLWSATGRFAEVAGPLVLERDVRVRQWGIDRRARELAEDADELDPGVRAWLQAYVDGVNEGRRLWLSTEGLLERLVAGGALGFDPVPQWMHPLRTQEDPTKRLRRLLEAEVGLEHVLALGLALAAGPELGGGGYATRTNVWAMRGAEPEPRTWLLADVHQPLQEFGYRSYFVQLAGPTYDVVGHSSPGFPCVVLGASRTLAFASMTLPEAPREVAAAGLAFRYGAERPLVAAGWSATLEPGPPPHVVQGPERLGRLELVERTAILRAWDVERGALVDDPRGPLTFRWLADPALGLELPVVDPPPTAPLDPAASPVVRWEARAFLGQRSVWETWLRLGTATGVVGGERSAWAALAREALAVGRGQLLLHADAGGTLGFVWSTRAAVADDPPVDGGGPWSGFTGFDALPKRARQVAPDETAAWILCNSSPDFLEAEPRALAFPPGAGDPGPWKSPRQDRARELFERAASDGRLEARELERMALDVQDAWSRVHWPWLAALAASESTPLTPRARAFVAWLERFRHEGPDGAPDAAEPFLAHPLSQAQPFLALLRDRYEDELLAARPGPDALGLAFDPLLAGTPPEEVLGAERFGPNRAALAAALEWTAELRERTLAGAEGGLVNAAFLRALDRRTLQCARVFPAPWDHDLYARQAPGWGADAPPVALRWGQVNVYALTPHRWPIDPVVTNAKQVEGWLASTLAPCTLEPPIPFHRAMPAVVFPVGGTHDSLFQVHREGFRSLAKALVPREGGSLALAPVDFGSQALFLAELVPGARPHVRVLPALGGTEVLVPLPELGVGALEPYRPTARFARGEWTTLETDEERLRAAVGVRSVTLGAR